MATERTKADDVVEGIERLQLIMIALQGLQRIEPILSQERASGGGKVPGGPGPGPGPGGEWFETVRWLLGAMEDSVRNLRNSIGGSR